jgi:hypothetical protein
MIFIDSNVPMYLVGSSPSHKIDSQRVLERCIANQIRLVTDAEVFQEIVHRYVAIGLKEAIQPAFETLLGVVDEVLSVELPDVQRAKDIVLAREHISSRDALHLAIMERHNIHEIMSFDQGFDGYPGVQRVRV